MKTSERLNQVIEALTLQPGNFMIKACINELQGIQVELTDQEVRSEAFSTRLDTMMRKKKLDREALASISGVSLSSIGRYLSGTTIPQPKQLERASKLKAGMTFETADGKLIRVLEASHHKPGKGNTIMRMKLRDVRTGSTFDTSYRPEEKFEQAIIETVPAQYLYQMDDTAYFMNTETYDQYEIPVVNVEEELKFILENSDVKIQFYGTEVIGVTVPTTVELVVTDTQPSIKGATVTGSGKPATLETGLVVNVPDFIEVGQKLIINTAEGTYVSRA